MGKYADVKTRKLVRFIKKLARVKGIAVARSNGRHTVIECIHTGQSYPLPLSHWTVKEPIVKGFFNWLIANDVCTQQEIDEIF